MKIREICVKPFQKKPSSSYNLWQKVNIKSVKIREICVKPFLKNPSNPDNLWQKRQHKICENS